MGILEHTLLLRRSHYSFYYSINMTEGGR